MRALQLIDGVGLEHLTLTDLPEPKPGPGEVAIRMRAASLNYRDLMMVEGAYGPRGTPLPLTPLSDGCGVVEATGEGVSRVAVGDRVCPMFFQKWLDGAPSPQTQASALGLPIPGVAREVAVYHEDGVSKVPTSLSDEEAACLPCAGLTAWRALFEDADLRPGASVLLEGTGGVSVFGLQFAHAAGMQTIITSSSDAKLERAKKLGADCLINYRQTAEWGRSAREFTSGRGVDFVMEVGGAGTLGQALRCIALGGHIAIIGVLGGAAEPLSIGQMIGTGAKLQGVQVGSRAMFERMGRFIEQAALKPVVDKVFPLAEARAAFEAMRAGEHFGKIVLRFD
ncbi:MAG TPA: NAD(P)-dependent alcohol dehydrogenase [Caulobacteraceae bacterium]|nr:NAD(P)-dependent alcohol dehydrogenase [Caulobacteraceae bacterium]